MGGDDSDVPTPGLSKRYAHRTSSHGKSLRAMGGEARHSGRMREATRVPANTQDIEEGLRALGVQSVVEEEEDEDGARDDDVSEALVGEVRGPEPTQIATASKNESPGPQLAVKYRRGASRTRSLKSIKDEARKSGRLREPTRVFTGPGGGSARVAPLLTPASGSSDAGHDALRSLLQQHGLEQFTENILDEGVEDPDSLHFLSGEDGIAMGMSSSEAETFQ